MINKEYHYAIIGASNNQSKYGYKILYNLKEKGLKMIPINPKEKTILELKCYSSLSEYYNQNLNQIIDVVIFIVPSNITEKILEEVKILNIKKVWMQPGSESKKAINFCKENKIELIYNSCIMLKSKDINQ